MLALLLVRHGSHGLLGRTLCGRMPGVSLSAGGRAEAERTAALLAPRGLSRVIASPLERAQETAAPLAARAGLAVETADEIQEIDCGDWTGAPFGGLPDDPLWHRWNRERATFRIPGGEGMADVQARALSLVRRLAAEAGDGDAAVALVTHADVVKALAMAALGLSLDRHDHLAVDPASTTTLHAFGDYMRLVRLNEVPPAGHPAP